MTPRRLSETSWKPSRLPWWKLRRRTALAIGQGYYGSPDLRLFLVACGRVGPWGHACFEPGELADLLPKVTRATGDLGHYSERALRGFIAELVDAGLLSPASNTRCLVVPIEVLDSQRSVGRITCPEHRCSHVWSTRFNAWVATKSDGSFDLEELASYLSELSDAA